MCQVTVEACDGCGDFLGEFVLGPANAHFLKVVIAFLFFLPFGSLRIRGFFLLDGFFGDFLFRYFRLKRGHGFFYVHYISSLWVC